MFDVSPLAVITYGDEGCPAAPKSFAGKGLRQLRKITKKIVEQGLTSPMIYV